MKLKNITFIFENCEVIEIDGKYIGDFIVDDITKSFLRTACNSIDKIDTAHTIAIEIHKDANKECYEFGQTQIAEFKQTVFDRLGAYNDITAIEFTLEDVCGDIGTYEAYHYYVDWTGDSEYSNAAQVNYQSNDGHFYILIKDNARLDDYFDMDLINDTEYTKFHFSMMDVGE